MRVFRFSPPSFSRAVRAILYNKVYVGFFYLQAGCGCVCAFCAECLLFIYFMFGFLDNLFSICRKWSFAARHSMEVLKKSDAFIEKTGENSLHIKWIFLTLTIQTLKIESLCEDFYEQRAYCSFGWRVLQRRMRRCRPFIPSTLAKARRDGR